MRTVAVDPGGGLVDVQQSRPVQQPADPDHERVQQHGGTAASVDQKPG
jgi:hypothetical protein